MIELRDTLQQVRQRFNYTGRVIRWWSLNCPKRRLEDCPWSCDGDEYMPTITVEYDRECPKELQEFVNKAIQHWMADTVGEITLAVREIIQEIG